MKVAVITREKPGVSETFINNHVKKLGYDVTLIYGGSLPHLSDKIPPARGAVTLSTLLQKIFPRWRKAFEDRYKSYALKRVLRVQKIDVALVEYLNIGANVFETLRQANIPMICTCLGYEISRYDVVEKYSLAYTKMFDYCSRAIVVSRHMIPLIAQFGMKQDRIIYSPAGPDLSFFELNRKPEGSIVAGVGRFVDKKAPHISILAFYKALQHVPDAKLIMAGEGPLLALCKDLVQGLGIPDKVKFLGNIDQDQQRDLMEVSSIFIQHSRRAENGDMEGTPVAILEASAAGLAIIATNHAGIGDVVVQNETGLLCDEGDVEEMANNLTKLLTDRQMASEMGARGRAFVAEHFSLESHLSILRKELTAVS